MKNLGILVLVIAFGSALHGSSTMPGKPSYSVGASRNTVHHAPVARSLTNLTHSSQLPISYDLNAERQECPNGLYQAAITASGYYSHIGDYYINMVLEAGLHNDAIRLHRCLYRRLLKRNPADDFVYSKPLTTYKQSRRRNHRPKRLCPLSAVNDPSAQLANGLLIAD